MKLTGETSVYGIIGYPVKHSLSPLMQTAAFQHLGIDAVYVPFEVNPGNLEEAVKGLKALNVKGFNVTVPHKENIVEHLDFLSEDAEFLQAVNTVKNEDGKLIGYNTDADGFLKSLIEEGEELQEKRVTILGAGGAARAVGYAVLKGGAKFINIVNRSFSKAKAVGELLSKKGNVLVFQLKENVVESLLQDTDILINTTSIGMKEDDPKLFNYELIPKGITVVDIIYNPVETLLLKVAKGKGCKTINGLGMLIHQGAIAFKIWIRKEAPVDLMRRILEEELYG
jgi:shikimate dehydrogenase